MNSNTARRLKTLALAAIVGSVAACGAEAGGDPPPSYEAALDNGDLSGTITVTSSWVAGYCANVSVRNRGTRKFVWSATVELGSGRLTQVWNAAHTLAGSRVIFSGETWNAKLGSGASTEFGFCAAGMPTARLVALAGDVAGGGSNTGGTGGAGTGGVGGSGGSNMGGAGEEPRTVDVNETGYHAGSFFSYWKDSGQVQMVLGAAPYDGNYSVEWDLFPGNFVGGKGWDRGTPTRPINFNAGVFKPGNNAYLTVYGWTRHPLVEYYVVENYSWTPPHGFQCDKPEKIDGAPYCLYRTERLDAPCIDGDSCDFTQYWSVRVQDQRRTSGTVNFGAHVAAWEGRGWRLGSEFSYQIMATEAFGSVQYPARGSSNVTVW
jgi:endo-1,4-beta-xylanase